MEGGKQSGSSLPADLFGAKDPPEQATSLGNFRTIFSPPSKDLKRESFQSLETEKKISSDWTSKNGVSVVPLNSVTNIVNYGREEQVQSSASKDKVLPFHYNSSIFYGGQDDYTPSESARTTFNKNEGEDESDSSSIRSWWQGSVYY